tara:strand:+ start:255 stop:1493 length:1239 start_codon:yes stop_codon:yes gene_type:complete
MANLTSLTIDGSITEKEGTGTVSGTSITVNLSTGNFFEIDLATATGNIDVITINNAASGAVSTFGLKIKQGVTVREINWLALPKFKWKNGYPAPTLTSEYERFIILSFTTYDNGTTWHGSVGGKYPRIIPSNIHGARGVIGGGHNGTTDQNVLEFVTIATTGDAADFGDLTVARTHLGSCSNGSRGVFGGGSPGPVNTLDYITIGSAGNATDFGDRTVTKSGIEGTSGGGRGIFGGHDTTIDYITISSAGNATDFGDLTVARQYISACSDGTRGLFCGGSGPSDVIDYVTIATTGNAIDFGNLHISASQRTACSDGARGIIGGGVTSGPTYRDNIDWITIATTGNAMDFGNLTTGRTFPSSTSNGSRGIFAGGLGAPPKNVLDYVTIASAGNATDFGDLTVAKYGTTACSGD